MEHREGHQRDIMATATQTEIERETDSAAPSAAKLLTAEEYAQLPDRGVPTELVKGVVIEMTPPYPRHGQVCSKLDRLIGNFAHEPQRGHVVSNDSGIITQRDPDTVRGPDVAFYSFERVPPGPFPEGQYLAVAPELAFEVLSPSNRRGEVHQKIGEYLAIGVRMICVLDSRHGTAEIFTEDDPVRLLTGDDELIFPGVLDGFAVPLRRVFE
jgi:Uma2 family endonuclease